MECPRSIQICAAVLLILLHSASAPAESAPRPNIVFILADDLGCGDVGWRGSKIKTPHLDALAHSGAALNQFYVQPLCTPTRAALMTGRYPFRYGLQVSVIRPWARYGLPLQERTLPQALRQAGYETAIVGKWHLGHFQKAYLPTQRGFDHQYGQYTGAIDYFTHLRDSGLDWHRDDQPSHDEGYTTRLLAREAVRVIRTHDRAKPLFLYVPFNAVHSPHQAPIEYVKRCSDLPKARQAYGGMVTAMDDAVGEIIAEIDKAGLRQNTLIIFASDNGGADPGRISSNGSFRAGKGTLYEGGVRSCAFAAWAGRIAPGTSIEQPLHMVDWYPTLLNLAGAPAAQPLRVDGRDMWATLTAGAPSPHEEIVLNITPHDGALRAGRWKLVLNGENRKSQEEAEADPRASDRRIELFDLDTDPGERANVILQHLEVAERLQKRCEELAAEQSPPKARPRPKGYRTPKVWGN